MGKRFQISLNTNNLFTITNLLDELRIEFDKRIQKRGGAWLSIEERSDITHLGIRIGQWEVTGGEEKALEDFITPVDFDIDGDNIRKGSWVMTVKECGAEAVDMEAQKYRKHLRHYHEKVKTLSARIAELEEDLERLENHLIEASEINDHR